MTITLPAGSALSAEGFLFGVATSAFQIEGAAAERLPCIWDTFCEQPGKIKDGSNGHVACDHLSRLEEDLDLLQWLGVDAYRFSVNWARFLREDDSPNPEGVAFYDRLVDGLLERGIQPFLTLYHWELPAHLEARGGWLNRDTADRFADYAIAVARALGDRVASYATLNEPWCSAWLGYGCGRHAPGLVGDRNYRHAAHHLLLAHGKAMDALRSETSAPLGIVLNDSPCRPAGASADDAAAARLARDWHFHWFFEPLLTGQYPELGAALAPADAPPVQDGDLNIISAPLDYLGLNYYTVNHYRGDGAGGFQEVPPAGELTAMGWGIYPDGLTECLVNLHERYEVPPIYICENGIALDDEYADGAVHDARRTAYLESHLAAVGNAMAAGVDVRGYFAWSLMDNFEWAEGYEKRFGLVWVDYESLERTPKASAHAYRDYLLGRSPVPRASEGR